MQVFPVRKTDEEYLDFIRRAYDITNRWKWLLIAFQVAVFVCCLVMAFGGTKLSGQLLRPPPIPMATFEMGWMMGCVTGFLFAFGLPGICIIIPMTLTELRTWKLLLTYHDRLQDAGLLPEMDAPVEQSLPGES